MDKESKQRIADYFDPWALVEFLGLTAEQVVDAFEDEIEESINDIEEEMGYKHDDNPA
jgi:hypothetical protein